MSAQPAAEPPADAPRIWRVADVAAYYGRSVRTVERWVAAGRLPPPRRAPGGRPFWPAREIVGDVLERPPIVPSPRRRAARPDDDDRRHLGEVVIGGRRVTVGADGARL